MVKVLKFYLLLGTLFSITLGILNCSGTSPSSLFSSSNSGPVFASASIQNQPGIIIPNDFIGFAHGYSVQDATVPCQKPGGLATILGTPGNLNPIYIQLLKNLLVTSSTKVFLRIGNSTTDSLPAPTSSSTPHDVQALTLLANQLGSQLELSMGVNMAARNAALAASQASYFVQNIPSQNLAAIELGNEPDLYVGFGFRANPYDYSTSGCVSLVSDINSALTAIGTLPQGTQIMGPSLGGHRWHITNESLPNMLTTLFQQETLPINIVSQHSYPGGSPGGTNTTTTAPSPTPSPLCVAEADPAPTPSVDPSPVCTPGPAQSTNVSIDVLLQQTAINDNTYNDVLASVPLVHQQANRKFRIGELNNIDSGGLFGVSDVFESALWVTDELFTLSSIGIDGVNILTGGQGGGYTIFNFTHTGTQWALKDYSTATRIGLNSPTYPGVAAGHVPIAGVTPTYYGMLLFQKATAGGGALLPVTISNPNSANLKVYAVVMPDQSMNVVILNKDEAITGAVGLTIPGNYGAGTLSWLLATPPPGTSIPAYLVSGATATGGGTVIFAGQTLEGSTDGTLQGALDTPPISPIAQQGSSSVYEVTMPVTSAVMMHLNPPSN